MFVYITLIRVYICGVNYGWCIIFLTSSPNFTINLLNWILASFVLLFMLHKILKKCFNYFEITTVGVKKKMKSFTMKQWGIRELQLMFS